MTPSSGAVGGVSVRGASHVQANMPNQDAVGHGREGDWFFLAVADGHGSRPHYRSDRGAAFAVETVLALLRRAAPEMAGAMPGRVLATLAGDLVAGWRERVEEDIRVSPVRERPGFESHAVYGSTCIAAAIGPGCSLFLQIGDGDILASGRGTEGRTAELGRVVPPDPRLVGPATFSLCQPDACERVQLRLFAEPHPLSHPDFVMAATDGLAKSYARDDDFLGVARHVRDNLRLAPLDGLLRDLEPWLSECSGRGSRDDVTVALFSATPESGPS